MINTGTINGRVGFQASLPGNTFINAGTINGSVSMGVNSANTFTAVTGSTVSNGASANLNVLNIAGLGLGFSAPGVIDGGAGGNNTLILQNAVSGTGSGVSGSGVIDGANYINFGNLRVNSGSWTLGGTPVPGSSLLNGGLVIFNNAGAFGSGLLTGNGGAIQAGSAGLVLTNAVSLDTGGLTAQGSNDFGLSGVINGSGALVKNGSSVLTLSGANNYSGGTTLSAGGLLLGNDLALGSGALSITGASNLSGTAARTLANAVVLSNNLSLPGSTDMTLNGVVSGTGSLTKIGGGTLALNGANTFQGGITLNTGTLSAGNASALGSGVLTVNGPGSLTSSQVLNLGNNVLLNDALTVSSPYNLGLTGALTGTGQLIKSGNNTLTLSGLNSHSGGTTLNAGTLNLGSNAALGLGALTVAGNSTLSSTAARVINNTIALNAALGLTGAQDLTLNGALSGSGSLTKNGAASLTLNSANTYAGGGHGVSGANLNIINAGTISAGFGGLAANPFAEDGEDGAAVQFTSGDNSLTLQTGSVINGVVWLMDDTRAFITADDAGLTLDDGVLLGNDAVLIMQTDENLSSGAITGAGSLTKTGSATLTLNGNSTYTAPTILVAGSLQAGNSNAFSAASSITVNAAATLDLNGFNQSIGSLVGSGSVSLGSATLTTGGDNASTMFSGAITGSGGLTKSGTGKLVLDGTNTYTGVTAVNAGSLIVGGSAGSSASLTSDVNVASGARLGGHGSITGDVTLLAGATLNPGYSIGTLTINGNATFDAASTLEFEANPDGTSDQLIVNGNLDLGGATLSVLAGAGTWSPATTYSIVTSSNPIVGTFGAVTSDLAFLTPTLDYSLGNQVRLLLARNDISYVAAAATRNQRAVATALGSAAGSLDSALLSLSTAQAQAAFDSLSGELHASTRSALFDDSRYAREAVIERLRTGQSGLASGDVLHSDADSGLTFWLSGYGNWSDKDGNSNVADLDRDSRGTLIGLDLPLNQTWRLGIAAGYGTSDLDVNRRESSADIGSTSLIAYLGGQWDALSLRMGVARTWNEVDSKRDVQVGALRETLKADYDADTTQVFGELGYALQLGELALEPFAGLAHVEVDSDGFREHGGTAALSGNSEDDSVDYSSLGLRAAAPLGDIAGLPLNLHTSLAWQHAFDEPSDESHLSLAGYDSFTVKGVPVAEDSALAQLGLDLQLSAQASVGLGYSGQFGDGNSDQGVRLTLSTSF
ncbi:autotransporter domain-containing protein [Pseudomonas sp. PDM14]|uniref:autotransporter outer membrane beta-barrel domain-containing protein n=1 Tax=Pseudomonas sp. PDM14 TaxID=2769288 RepID=UPI001CE06F0F|nr:autotransporter domain-containing protein [Pseudomonas sp. PDM14]